MTQAVVPSVVIGLSGARRNAAAALVVDGECRAICELERVTRVRGAALTPGAIPAEAVAAVLRAAGGFHPSAIRMYAVAEERIQLPRDVAVERIDHHEAHAATAFRLSPFESAAVLVCDSHRGDTLSVWAGEPEGLTRLDWPRAPWSFANLYSECAVLFGFGEVGEHQLEALARIEEGSSAGQLEDVITWRDGGLQADAEWRALVADWLGAAGGPDLRRRARVASAFQGHLGALVLKAAREIRARTGQTRLCLCGGLFYNTALTTLVRQSGIFDDVHVPANPGNAATAVGAALVASGIPLRGSPVSPFLGPEYSVEEIKQTLDNCKLSYECPSDSDVIEMAASAIARGQLVGWFQGRMESGHRALGHRSILANPMSPYVLDNLNVFLKQRPHHRAYGVSVPEGDASRYFDGPAISRSMEYEYTPRDREQFRHVMPDGTRSLRVQTVPGTPDTGAASRFARLHEVFRRITGVPVLVNTSFNGFSEPMVCSPRDAIRVFFGTGLDMLALDRFVLHK
jgi:carbamoyltransferase